MLTVYQYGMSHPVAAMRTTGMNVMELVIWAIGIFLLWYAWTMEKKGVLR